MRITLQITCESPEEAQDAVARLTRPRTWEDDVDARHRKERAVDTARLDKIMGSSATGAEQSGSNDGATGAPRPNISPGEPSIGKIGGETKETLLGLIKNGQQPATKWTEHCKLLCKRGEIKYDGKEFYL